MNYEVVFSKRKTLSLCVKDGKIILTAPFGAPKRILDSMVEKHAEWIEKQLIIDKKRASVEHNLTLEEIKKMKLLADKYFKEKTAEYAAKMGLKYSNIKITSAKHRFGSCSAKGNICFSYMLMLYPEEAREYVIVHELSHLVYMNHSPDFYRAVTKFMPDWKSRRELLKSPAFD